MKFIITFVPSAILETLKQEIMITKTKNNIWLIAFSVVLLGLLAWYFQAIIVYLFVSAVLSIIGRPIVELLVRLRIRKGHLPAGFAALVALLLFYSVLLTFLLTMMPLITHQAEIISNIDTNTISGSIQNEVNLIDLKLHQYHLMNGPKSSVMGYISDALSKAISVTNLTDFLNSAVGFTGNIFVALFSISFITFFFLKDQKLFVNLLFVACPEGYVGKLKHILHETKRMLTRYFMGLLIEMLLVSVLLSIGLGILGVDNAILIGFIGGILIIIPYIGSLVGAALGILVGISTNLGADFHAVIIPLILKMCSIFLFVHTIDPLIFQPIIYSRSVQAHPLEIFLVILIAGKIGGIPGMIVAVPVYTIFRIIAKESLNELKIVDHLTRNI